MIADAESVLIFVGPPERYLDDALQVGQRAAGSQLHPAPDLPTHIPQRNVESIDDRRCHNREHMPPLQSTRDRLQSSAPALS